MMNLRGPSAAKPQPKKMIRIIKDRMISIQAKDGFSHYSILNYSDLNCPCLVRC